MNPGEGSSFDPHATAVERFLKGVELRYQQVALDAALPRQLNRDVLAELIGTENADAFFGWLKRMPFVRQRGEGWEYHSVVRHLMLVYMRRESPERWAGLHRRLAAYYEQQQKQLGLSEARQIQDSVWRAYALDVLYHRRCAGSHRALGLAIEGFLAALKFQRAFAEEWAETLQDAEKDAPGPEELRWGERLTAALEAVEDARYSDAIGTFTALVGHDDLAKEWRAIAFNWRGYLYRMSNQLETALPDLTAAIDLVPDDGEYWADRGWLLFLLERYIEALTDLSHAVAFDPEVSRYFAMRGLILTVMDRYEDANADFARAMAMEPQNPILASHQLLLALRRKDTAQMGDALLRISSQAPQFVALLREAFQEFHSKAAFDQMRQFFSAFGLSEILSDQNSLQQLDSLLQGSIDSLVSAVKASAFALQSFNYKQSNEPNKALDSIGQAIEADPSEPQYLLARADILVQMGRHEEALMVFEQAITLKPQSAEVFGRRGNFYMSQGRMTEALADYSQAIGLAPSVSLFMQRGTLHRWMGHYQDALADLDRAIALRADDLLLVYCRIPLQVALNDISGAADTLKHLASQATRFIQQLKDLVATPESTMQLTILKNWLLSAGFLLEADPELPERLVAMIQGDVEAGGRVLQADAAILESTIHTQRKEFSEALAVIGRALRLMPGQPSHLVKRAETYMLMGRYDDSLSDLNQALALRPGDTSIQFVRGRLFLQMKRMEDALDDVEQVLSLRPGLAIAHAMRSDALMHMGRYTEALDAVSRALELEPTLILAISIRVTLWFIQERYAEALDDLDQLFTGGSSRPEGIQPLRGELLCRLGRYDEAMDVYRKVLAKEPENWRVAYNLVATRARLEGPMTVADELAQVLGQLQAALTQDRASALVRLAGLEALTDNIDQAFNLLDEALSLDPHIIHWVKGDLAWSHLREGPRFQALLGPQKVLSH